MVGGHESHLNMSTKGSLIKIHAHIKQTQDMSMSILLQGNCDMPTRWA